VTAARARVVPPSGRAEPDRWRVSHGVTSTARSGSHRPGHGEARGRGGPTEPPRPSACSRRPRAGTPGCSRCPASSRATASWSATRW
jgi:hypothetical protein